MFRQALFLAIIALLALGLAACGGGSSPSAPPTTSSAPAPQAGVTEGTSRAPRQRPKAKPAAKQAKSAQVTEAPAPQGRKGGGSAPFRVRHGDNSIPNYGSETSGSQRSEATGALRSYLAARAGGDWSTACSYLGGAVHRQLELFAKASGGKTKGCAGAYATFAAHIPKAQRANPLTGGLASLRVKGNKAFALFYGPHNQKYMMPMVSEGGAWKVNQLDPIPWPIGSAPASP